MRELEAWQNIPSHRLKCNDGTAPVGTSFSPVHPSNIGFIPFLCAFVLFFFKTRTSHSILGTDNASTPNSHNTTLKGYFNETLTGFALLLMAATATAQDRWHLEFRGGASFATKDFGTANLKSRRVRSRISMLLRRGFFW